MQSYFTDSMMNLLRRALLPVVIGLISNTMVARADLEDEYNVQQLASFERAQFVDEGSSLTRYHLLKNGDIYIIGPSPWAYKDSPISARTLTIRIGNLNETNRTSGNTCYYGNNFACAVNIVITETEYKIKDCKLYKYQRQQYTRGGEFGKIEMKHLATCREGFSQRSK